MHVGAEVGPLLADFRDWVTQMTAVGHPASEI